MSACIAGLVQALPVHSLAGASSVGGESTAKTRAALSMASPNANTYVPGMWNTQPVVGRPVSSAVGHVLVGPRPISIVMVSPGCSLTGSGPSSLLYASLEAVTRVAVTTVPTAGLAVNGACRYSFSMVFPPQPPLPHA